MLASTMVHATFLVTAPDQPGLVARLAGFFYALGLNIVDAGNHSDGGGAGAPPRFFMRLVVDLRELESSKARDVLGGSATRTALEAGFGRLVDSLNGAW